MEHIDDTKSSFIPAWHCIAIRQELCLYIYTHYGEGNLSKIAIFSMQFLLAENVHSAFSSQLLHARAKWRNILWWVKVQIKLAYVARIYLRKLIPLAPIPISLLTFYTAICSRIYENSHYFHQKEGKTPGILIRIQLRFFAGSLWNRVGYGWNYYYLGKYP